MHTGSEDVILIPKWANQLLSIGQSTLLHLGQTVALQKDFCRTGLPVTNDRLDMLFSCLLKSSGYLKSSLHHDIKAINQWDFL